MFGREIYWKKQKGPDLLQISDKEKENAKLAVERFMSQASSEELPVRLTREKLRELQPAGAKHFLHTVFVLPLTPDDPEYQQDEPGYKIGFVARSKEVYTTSGTIREGILGHGAFGAVKIIQWEHDNSIDAVKIESADIGTEKEREVENQIMKDLGYLRAAFIEKRKKEKKWIGSTKIKDRLYTVQKRLAGIEMKDYFRNVDIENMDPATKYEIGLKAAASIEELHDKGILHCDIKPANFLINWEDDIATVSAVDFGLSMRLKERQEKITAPAKGTPLYVAPEVAEYERDSDGKLCIYREKGQSLIKLLSADGIYSKAADIFSLGIMFRDDLKLGEPESPLHDLVNRMTSRNPEDRPSIQEVTTVLLRPENYEKFAKLYGHLDTYAAEKTQKQQSWMIARSSRIDPAVQIQMADTLENILKQHRLAPAQNDKLVDETANKILSLMKDNQNRHEKARFATASTFNLKTLQNLPEELRNNVCKKLGIANDSKILHNTNYSTRKQLAELVHNYQSPQKDEKLEVEDEHPRPGL